MNHLLVFLFTLCLGFNVYSQVPTPKWSFLTTTPPGRSSGGVAQSGFDGTGGSVWNFVFSGTPENSVFFTVRTIVWLDANGRLIYSNTFEAPVFAPTYHSDTRVEIMRFSRTELALLVRVNASGAGGTPRYGTNYLLQVRKARVGVTTSHTPLNLGEETTAWPGTPADRGGLFTHEGVDGGVLIRRYKK